MPEPGMAMFQGGSHSRFANLWDAEIFCHAVNETPRYTSVLSLEQQRRMGSFRGAKLDHSRCYTVIPLRYAGHLGVSGTLYKELLPFFLPNSPPITPEVSRVLGNMGGVITFVDGRRELVLVQGGIVAMDSVSEQPHILTNVSLLISTKEHSIVLGWNVLERFTTCIVPEVHKFFLHSGCHHPRYEKVAMWRISVLFRTSDDATNHDNVFSLGHGVGRSFRKGSKNISYTLLSSMEDAIGFRKRIEKHLSDHSVLFDRIDGPAKASAF